LDFFLALPRPDKENGTRNHQKLKKESIPRIGAQGSSPTKRAGQQ
jgi:hypothetical protein